MDIVKACQAHGASGRGCIQRNIPMGRWDEARDLGRCHGVSRLRHEKESRVGLKPTPTTDMLFASSEETSLMDS